MTEVGVVMSTSQPESAPDRPADVSRLVEFLSDRDAPCPLCGYNLRGLTGDICPECGRHLQLTVGLVEPYLRAWVLLAAAVFSAGGLGIVFVVALFAAPSGPPAEMLLAVGYFILAVPGSVAVLVYRRRFLRLSREVQMRVAWLAAGATVAAYLLLFSKAF